MLPSPSLQSTHYSTLAGRRTAFWSYGNRPTQVVDRLTTREVINNLKTLYLLSDTVVGSASFFLESDVTREAATVLRELFESGDVLFFVDESSEDFREHAARKVNDSPANMECYRDPDAVIHRVSDLDALGHIMRRPAGDISDRIVDLWQRDIASEEVGTLGAALRRTIPDSARRERVAATLSAHASNRTKEFVWEYVEPKLRELELDRSVVARAHSRLAQMYSFATAELLGAAVDRRESVAGYVTSRSMVDTALFRSCTDVLGVTPALDSLSSYQLVALKQSTEFLLFREFYFQMIQVVSSPSEFTVMLPMYRVAAASYLRQVPLSMTPEQFTLAFGKMWSSFGRPSPQRHVSPLQALVRSYDVFNRRFAIEAFVEKVVSLLGQAGPPVSVREAGAVVGGSLRTPLRILFVHASTSDRGDVRSLDEYQAVTEAITRGEYRNLIEVRLPIRNPSGTLLDDIVKASPAIVHFCGHGIRKGKIVLRGQLDRGVEVPISALAELMSNFAGHIRCVVLNACYTDEGAKAVTRCIDFVVGATEEVHNLAAIGFADGFYTGLSFNKSLSQMHQLGASNVPVAMQGKESAMKLSSRPGCNPADFHFF